MPTVSTLTFVKTKQTNRETKTRKLTEKIVAKQGLKTLKFLKGERPSNLSMGAEDQDLIQFDKCRQTLDSNQ